MTKVADGHWQVKMDAIVLNMTTEREALDIAEIPVLYEQTFERAAKSPDLDQLERTVKTCATHNLVTKAIERLLWFLSAHNAPAE